MVAHRRQRRESPSRAVSASGCASTRAWALGLCALWLVTGATGCDKLKELSGSASAEAEESAPAEESAESDGAPKKGNKGKAKKKKAAKAADTGPAPVEPPPPPIVPLPPAPTPPPSPPAPAINYFADATGIPQKLKDRIGPTLRVYELTIYPTYSFAKIQDPAQPLHIDQYEVRDGNVGPATPVKFVGKEPTEIELKNVTFDLGEPDWAQVPRIIDDAPKHLGVEDPKVTHVTARRPLPFEREVRFRVYVDGPRAGGSVEYDVKGVMRKVYK